MQTEQGTGQPMTRVTASILALLLMLGMCSGESAGQSATRAGDHGSNLPFVTGESLTYSVTVGNIASGRGTMVVEGPVALRGVATLLLRSDMRAGTGLLNGSGRSRSWLDSERMTSLRFSKDERRVLSRYSEAVDMYPAERRWKAADGRSGTNTIDAPLDELSFIYFIRTLPLEPGATYSFTRHFEQGRNPVAVTVLGRETVSVGAGTFATVVVEMRVKDPRNYRGQGIIRLYMTDDECRTPVRIASSVPGIGRTLLELEAAVQPRKDCSSR
jgi:hypothetical protein